MQIDIITFGQLSELIGGKVELENISDTDHLKKTLEERYPGLSEIKYRIAVNKKLITGNTFLTDKTAVALLPAFSGG